ncbi:HAD-IB family phosphatase [Paenibacillus provencensis]|uniref:phosphoserine phosphatase n=1 Tax=Paenibacillus provencensis TaxID=441151 RepID=A0ABW3QCS9_9BACL|nr:HAD-IB family phosphatase [Paenibacillus sp. MER 78]MCM3128279.1 HAD-IB family phosphatase [Paenibacillus sp. MER 78]
MHNSKYNFLFDLDGTITKEEILPVIAREVGLSKEISELTEKTIKGLIPFQQSFLYRVELLKHVPVSQVRDIVSRVALNQHVVDFIRDNDDKCSIVTGNLDVWVSELCKNIGVKYYSSKAFVQNDYICTVTKVLKKADVMNCINGRVVAIGEGNNDADMIKNAEIGIAFGGVHMPADSVLEYATHAIFKEESLCQFLRQL